MAVKLVVNTTDNAADLIAGYGTLARIYLYSAASEAGAYTVIDSLALAAGTEQYEFWDATGTSATWYKARFGNLLATVFSDYSDAFQSSAITAYATLDDLLETMDIGVGSGSTGRLNLLADLLADASAMIDVACGRRFYRDPQVGGTATFTFDVIDPYATTLTAAIGRGVDIISVTTLEHRGSTTGAYATIAAGDTGYLLDRDADALGTVATHWPYTDLSLSPDSATRTTWPTGRSSIRLVGALGFPRVPALVKRACVDLARDMYRQGPGGGAQQAGVNQFGTPIFATGMPQSFRTLTATAYPFVRRTFAAWV